MAEESEKPPFSLRPLPEKVARRRAISKLDNAAFAAVVAERSEVHLEACRNILELLKRDHRNVIESTDLDPGTQDRAAALWLLSGRALGLFEALIVQAEGGIDNEIAITGRAIHEISRVLFVFGLSDETELLNLWLADEGKSGYVRPGAAADAQERFEEKLAEIMVEQGHEPLTGMRALGDDIYDQLSRVAHNRRSSCLNSYSGNLREMVYGQADSPFRRAGTVEWVGTMAVSVANSVGPALEAFYGAGYFADHVKPSLVQMEEVVRDVPLDEGSIRRVDASR